MTKPKIIHISSGNAKDADTARRMKLAKESWKQGQLAYVNWLDVELNAFPRDARSIGDSVNMPFIRDMIEMAVLESEESDVLFITNADICIHPGIGDEIAKLCAEKGACYAYRWDFPKLDKLLASKEEIAKGKWYIGCDAFAFTKRWWVANKHKYPDFVLGRECWDWIMRALITETGGVELEKAIYHEKHVSPWKQGRLYQPGNMYNRSLARAWLDQRKLPLREIANAPFKQDIYNSWLNKITESSVVYIAGEPVPGSNVTITQKYALIVTKQVPMDVLIVLGKGSKWNNNELKYCLRSLEKHAKNMGKLYVVGQDPGFLNPQTVNFVKREDAAGNKEYRIAEQVAWAADKLPMTEQFLWMNDDFFLLQDTDITQYPYYNDGDLTAKWNRAKPGGYRAALMQTDAQLKAHKYPTRNFEIHVPIRYSRNGFSQQIIKKFLSLSSRTAFGMTFRSAYCNVLGVKPGPAYKDMKLGNVATSEELKNKTTGRHCFSIGDGLSDDAKGYFDVLFPVKSKYEL